MTPPPARTTEIVEQLDYLCEHGYSDGNGLRDLPEEVDTLLRAAADRLRQSETFENKARALVSAWRERFDRAPIGDAGALYYTVAADELEAALPSPPEDR